MLQRIITGIVLIPAVVMLVLNAPYLWLSVVVSIITLIALWEYNSFVIDDSISSGKVTERAGLVTILLGVFVPAFYSVYGAGSLFPYLIFSLLVIVLVSAIGRESLKGSITEASLRFFGIVYIAVTLSHMIALSAIENGRLWLLVILIIVWANDTFAYFGGRLIGKNKLAPSISPGKTIEGAVIGLLGGILSGFAFDYYYSIFANPIDIIVVTLGVGVLSIIGDLVESILKRSAGVKDSGSILPGHGGLLDRIDSLIFVIPAVYYYVSFGWFV